MSRVKLHCASLFEVALAQELSFVTPGLEDAATFTESEYDIQEVGLPYQKGEALRYSLLRHQGEVVAV